MLGIFRHGAGRVRIGKVWCQHSGLVRSGQEFSDAASEGILTHLMRAGVRVIPDICWCSITEPVFPKNAKIVMTNSGKYSHYGKGLTGRDIRFGSLKDCAVASQTGEAPSGLPSWLC